LGAYPSWRANAAFSLYGTLKGESDEGCSKKTFINSFHTTEGIESFTNAVAAAGLTNLFAYQDGEQEQQDDDAVNDQYLTSQCFQNEDEGGNNGDDDSITTGQKYDQNAVSYGMGCTADRDFAIYTFGGAYCDANNMLEVQDLLTDFNQRIDMAKCVPIYKDGDYYSNNDQDGGNDEDGSSPLALLESSKSCQLYDGLGSCPDPYGKLKKYQKQLSQATGSIEYGPWWSPRRVMIAAWAMISSGALLALVGFILVIKECCSPSTASSSYDDAQSPRKMARGRSEVSAAPSLASQISRTISETITGASRAGSRRSNRSSRSRSSRKSTKSRSSKSMKSSKTNKTGQSRRSNRSSLADKEIQVSKAESYRSNHSNLSDPDQDEEEARNTNTSSHHDEESIASQGAKAFSDIVEFVKTRTNEFFEDENDDETPETKETKIPDKLPRSSSRRTVQEDDGEVSTFTEEPTKKWRKRRWFKKLLGRK
jgi:hypothetical protein